MRAQQVASPAIGLLGAGSPGPYAERPTCSSPRHKMWNHVRAAKMIWKRVGIAVLLTASSFLLAAQQDSQSMIAAIKAEGPRGTEATVLFHTLTDTMGPRLTGSPAHMQAARWAVERLNAWGLDNPRLEPFQFGRGWSLEKLTVEMTAPRYMPLN